MNWKPLLFWEHKYILFKTWSGFPFLPVNINLRSAGLSPAPVPCFCGGNIMPDCCSGLKIVPWWMEGLMGLFKYLTYYKALGRVTLAGKGRRGELPLRMPYYSVLCRPGAGQSSVDTRSYNISNSRFEWGRHCIRRGQVILPGNTQRHHDCCP